MTRLGLGVTAAAALLATASQGQAASSDPAADYRLHCSGCHKPDGSGQRGIVPPLPGQVGQFLRSSEGRTYLGQVPGVAQSTLDNRRLADLLNWMVARFDPDGRPAHAAPYTADEIRRLRQQPASDPARRRNEVLQKLPPGLP